MCRVASAAQTESGVCTESNTTAQATQHMDLPSAVSQSGASLHGL